MEPPGTMLWNPGMTFAKATDGQASNTRQITSRGPTSAVTEEIAAGALWPSTMFTAAERATHAGSASIRPSTAHGGWSASGTVSPLVLLLHTLQRVHRQEASLQSRVRRRLRFEDGPAISRALVMR